MAARAGLLYMTSHMAIGLRCNCLANLLLSRFAVYPCYVHLVAGSTAHARWRRDMLAWENCLIHELYGWEVIFIIKLRHACHVTKAVFRQGTN